MFWIPICFLVFVWWLITKAYGGVTAIGANRRAEAHAEAIREFQAKTNLSRELEYEIRKRLDHNFTEQRRVILDFMGSDIEEQDVFAFAVSTLRPAYRILAAQQGRVWSMDGWGGTTPPMQSEMMDQPWKIFELTERMFLRMEDEMIKHGVNTKIMADYIEYHFEPVREHVARCGFGKLDGRVHFVWAQYSPQWESIT